MDDLSESPTAENDKPRPDDAPGADEPTQPEAPTPEQTPPPDEASTPDEQVPPETVSKPEEPPAPTPPPAEDVAPAAPADAAAVSEPPPPSPPKAESATPTTAEAIASSSPTSPRRFSVAALLRRIGAVIGVIGALLVFGGVFLPTYGSGDYEESALHNAPWLPLALLVAPALLMLGISINTWFRKPPLWLVVLGCLFIILAVWVHWLVEALFAGFACFDVCPPGGVHYGTGFWLPLIGFPVSGVGIIFAALASVQWRRKQAAQTSDSTAPTQSE